MSQVVHALVFIDANVTDVQHLVDGVRPGYQAHVLKPNQDGIEQITATLQAAPAEARQEVHIISHGAPGTLFLGNSQLSLDTLERYTAQLQTWFANSKFKIQNSKSLYLYGCNVAAGDAGAEFLAKVHGLTGAAIGASTSPVGNAELGGSWYLDVAIGSVKKLNAITLDAQLTYGGTFAEFKFNLNSPGAMSDASASGDGFSFFSIDASGVTGTVIGLTLGLNIDHAERGDFDAVLYNTSGSGGSDAITLFGTSADNNANYDILLRGSGGTTLLNDGDADDTTLPFYERTVTSSGLESTTFLDRVNAAGPNGTWTLRFIDRDFNGIAGLLNDAELTIFTDSTAPTLSVSSPVDEATGVPVASNIILTFDEDVRLGPSGTIEIRLASDNSIVESFDVATSTQLSVVNNSVTFDPSADLPESTDFYVNVSAGAIEDLAGNDFAGITDTTTLNFTTETGNTTPTDLAIDATSVDENVAANTPVGTFTTTDADAGDTFTYSLVTGDGTNDADNAAFTIGGTNSDQLLINKSPDFETQSSYNILVETKDAAGATYQEALTITVNDLDEVTIDVTDPSPPLENGDVLTANVSDVSATPTGYQWQRDAAGDGNFTNIAGATNQSYTLTNDDIGDGVRVVVSTSGGDITSSPVSGIEEANVDPVISSSSSVDFAENSTGVVVDVNASDGNAGDTVTFGLAAGGVDNDFFTINPTSGEVTFNSPPDFETPQADGGDNVYNILVEANDSNGGIDTQDIAIRVTDVNEAPINQGNFDDEGASVVINLDEDSTFTFSSGNPISVSDPDNGETFNSVALSVTRGSLSLTVGSLNVVGNGQNTVTINGATATQVNDALATLVYIPPADFNSVENSQVTFTINTTDDEGLFDRDTFTFNILPINDPATIGGTTTGSVTESNSGNPDTATGTLTAEDVDNTDDTFIAQTGTLGSYGTFDLTTGGNWEYTLTAELPGDFSGTENFTVASQDGTEETVTIAVNGTNDEAIITAPDPAVSGLVEDQTPSGNGAIGVTDVDGAAEEAFVAKTGPNALNGTYGTLTVFANGNLNYVLDDSRDATQALSDTDTVFDTFTVETVDGTTQEVKVSITGSNDPATISGPNTGSIQEGGTPNTVSNTLVIEDVDATTAEFSTVVGGSPSQYGSLTITESGVWTYTLDNSAESPVQALKQGQTVTDTFTVESSDGTDTETITITITGTNDAPVVSGPVTPAGVLETDATFTVDLLDGASDVEKDPLSVNGLTVSSGDNVGITLSDSQTLSVDPSQYDFLAEGEEEVVTYTYTIKDGSGGSVSQTASISITGVNDAANITGDVAGDITEDADPNTVSGDLNATDVDSSTDFTAETLTGTYGSLAIDAAGGWTYTLDNTKAATDALNASDSETESFTVKTADGTEQGITITVTGANDDADITGDVTGAITEDATPNTVTGDLNATDVDSGTNFVAETLEGTYGSLAIDAAGGWTYTLDNTKAATNALNASDSETESFTVKTEDGTEQSITITVTGANDDASITGDSNGEITEDATPNTVSGDLNATDVDSSTDFVAETFTGTYGSLDIDTAGGWTYTLDNTKAETDALNASSAPEESFTVKTSDGTEAIINITVNGANDEAVITGDVTGAITEDATPNTVTGALTAADADSNPNFVAETLTGTYGSLAIDTAGGWTYTLDNTKAETEALNTDDTPVESFTVKTADGTEETIEVTVTGANDDALITGDITGIITEDADPNTVTGDLNATDVDSSTDFVAETLEGTYGSLEINTAGGWTYTLDNSKAETDALNASDSEVESFTVKTADGTEETIEVTVTGANDDALITGDVTGAVSETGDGSVAPETVSGDLNATDVDSSTDFVAETLEGTYGSLDIDAAGSWTYTLDNTKEVTDVLNTEDSPVESFTVGTVDGTEQTIDITVTGANDDALITGDITGAITEDATPNTVSGDLTAADADSSTDFVEETLEGTYGSLAIATTGSWTYTLDNTKEVTDALNDSDSEVESFTVKTADGTEQTIDITVTGANDSAEISGTATGSVTEDATPNTATGSLTALDADSSASFIAETLEGTYGSLAIDAAGDWTYTLDNADTDTDALNDSDTPVENFTVKTTDGTEQTIDITVIGTNDAADITGDVAGDITEGADPNTISGALTATDVDSAADFAAETLAGTYGSLAIAANGNWTYTLDNTKAETEALNAGDTPLESFTVKTADGTEQTIDITVIGTNDAADITGDITGAITEDATPNTVSGGLTATDVDSSADFVAETLEGTYGSLAIAATGDWTYTLDNTNAETDALNAGDTPTESFTVKTADGTEQTIDITVTGANDAADISGDTTGNVQEDITLSASGTLIADDADDPSTFQEIVGEVGTYGTFTLQTSGAWSYTLNNEAANVQSLAEGEVKEDTFQVISGDGSTTETVAIAVTGTDDSATISGNVVGTIDEDGTSSTVTGQLFVTDVDSADQEFNPLTEEGTYGSFTIDAAGNWTYTIDNDDPDTDALSDAQEVTDTFTATTPDGTSKDVVITVQGTNDAPKGSLEGTIADSKEDQEREILAINLLQDFSDPEFDPQTIQNISAVNGTIVNNGNGTLTYTPTPNYNGPETLTFDVSDGIAATSGVTRTFTVTAVNDAPTGTPDGVLPATDEDVAVTFDLALLTSGFSDGDGDLLGVSALAASSGAIVNNGNGTLTYTPGADFNGDVTLTYTVTDGKGGNIPNQSRTLVVNPINDVPTGSPTGTIPNAVEDTETTINRSTLIAGFSDADGDILTIKSIAVDVGTVTPTTGSGPFTYTPVGEYNGPVTLTYTIEDGNGGFLSNQQRTFNVLAENDAPEQTGALGVISNGLEDEVLLIENSTLVEGFADIDGDELFAIAPTVSEGTIIDNGDGTFSYTPPENFNGDVTLTYLVTDDNGGVIPDVTQTFSILSVNDAPAGEPTGEVSDTNENTDLVIETATLLEGFTDIDGDTLSVKNVTVSSGALSQDSATSLLYAPDPGFTGDVTLTYSVSDGDKSVTGITQTFEVLPINDPPVGSITLSGSPIEDATLTANTSNLSDQDGLPDPATFAYQWQASPDGAEGTWTDIAGATAASFTMGDAEVGSFLRVVVSYVDNEGFEEVVNSQPTAQAIANINDPPVGTPTGIVLDTEEDTPLIIATSVLLEGFVDDDGDVLRVADLTASTGAIAATQDGFLFTPDENASGPVTLTYSVTDDVSGAITGVTREFAVIPVNDLPVVEAPIEVTATEDDVSLKVNLLQGTSDIEGDSLTVANLTATGDTSGITLDGTTLTVNPEAYDGLAADAIEVITYSYDILDSGTVPVSQTATISITGVNDAPIGKATAALRDTLEDATVVIDMDSLLEGFSDPDGDPLSLENVATDIGTIELGENGNYSFTPDLDYVGPVNLTYDVSDGITSISAAQTFDVRSDQVSPVVFSLRQQVQFIELDDGISYSGPSLDSEIGGIDLASIYDESYYLAENPDVASVIQTGVFVNGFEHFLRFGLAEGRNPSLYYDEQTYLARNTDVAEAVASDAISSGLVHYLQFGHIENRVASNFFDPNDYLLDNPDVAQAVQAGLVSSGFEHFVENGASEGRQSVLLFEEAFYLSQNTDVAEVVAAGAFQSGFEHYIRFGQQEGRDPGPLFDESAYLGSNPDVAEVVSQGLLSSGMEHFFRNGREESRPQYTPGNLEGFS